MNSSCAQCTQTFQIYNEDIEFYKKMRVPTPTFCPQCRMQRRMTWRNERTLYNGTCSATGKPIITIFDPAGENTVYDRDYWWSDAWSPLEFSADYDFSLNFFEQFQILLQHSPQPAVFNNKCTNSNYCNHVGELKDCYLTVASWGGENVAYSAQVWGGRDCFDLLGVSESELCLECVNSDHLYNCQFVQNSENCTNCMLLYECRSCTNCFGCVNLRNKSFHIFNQPYSEADYHAKLKSLKLDTAEGWKNAHEEFAALKLNSIHRYASIYNSDNSTGDNLQYAHNCQECFGLKDGVADCKYAVNGGEMTDSYDGYGVGAKAELLYEVVDTGVNASRLLFGAIVWGGTEVEYSYNCHNSKNIFGCVGLRGAQYCILNKQYTKEEYEQLLPKIKQHMMDLPYQDSQGIAYRYGEFFPTEISPFAYNETVAQEYFNLQQSEVEQRGYRWKQVEERDISAVEISGTIHCAHKLECNEQCTGVFKIMPKEQAYYERAGLALPTLCPNCRHYRRLHQRNPLKLWDRQCDCKLDSHDHVGRCSTQFASSFAPERPEQVFCELCYQKEVY